MAERQLCPSDGDSRSVPLESLSSLTTIMVDGGGGVVRSGELSFMPGQSTAWQRPETQLSEQTVPNL